MSQTTLSLNRNLNAEKYVCSADSWSTGSAVHYKCCDDPTVSAIVEVYP